MIYAQLSGASSRSASSFFRRGGYAAMPSSKLRPFRIHGWLTMSEFYRPGYHRRNDPRPHRHQLGHLL